MIPFLVLALSLSPVALCQEVSRPFAFRLIAEPETLDWNKAHTPVETHLLLNLMEGLVELNADLKVVPALAERWEISSDFRRFVFHLRSDARWSDGAPVEAQHFVASWKRLLSRSTAAAYAYLLFDLVNARAYHSGALKDFSKVGVRALNSRTLEVRLVRSVPHWLFMPTFWPTFPIRDEQIAQHGRLFTRPGKLTTTGPFQLAAHEVDSKITLVKNPHYYASRKVSLERVEALVVADHSTALNLYESGRLDFTTDLSPVDLKRLEKNPALKVFPYLKTVYLGMVTDHPFLRDPRARQAIAMSLEKHSLTRMLQGGQTPATSFVPPRMDGHDPESGLRYDLKQAATLWNSIPEKERPKKLSLITQNWDKNIAVGQYLQEQLRKGLNLEIEILSLDHKAYQAVAAGGKHPLFLRSWSADYPDPENFLSVFLSDSGNNRARWKSFKFDQKVRAATENLQQKERLRLYREAQRILLQEEAVIVPLYYEPNVTLLRPGVEGLVLTPLNSLFLKGVRFPRPPSN